MSRNSALTARARRYLADAAHAFERAPVEVTLSVLLAASFSYAVSSDAEPFREWAELGIIMVLSGAIAFTATLLHALGAWSTRTRWLVTGAGVAAAALYGVFVLDLRPASEAWRAAALLGAGALVVLSAPALAGRQGASERFRRVTGRLLLRTITVLLYAAALYAGLALALGAVNTLFELDLDARIYAHTLGWVFFVLVTWVIVGGLPDYVRPGEDAGPVGAAVHRISAYLVTPLLAIYYLILYAYGVRIALTGELPKNLVSPLVIAAGLLAAIALILFDRDVDRDAGVAGGEDRAADAGVHRVAHFEGGDDRDADAGSGSFRWLRITIPLFLPLCALGIWALSMRFGQYGWTEFRAYRVLLLVMLGGLALAAAVRALRRRSLPVHVVPLTLATAAVLSSIGPWSAIATSRRSQQARLASAMSDAGIEWSATSVGDTLIASEPFMQISETTRYLLSHFGADALPPLFERHADENGRYVDVVYAAGLRSARPDVADQRGVFTQVDHGAPIGGADTMYYVSIQGAEAMRRQAARASADSIATDTTALSRVRVDVAGMMLFVDLRPLIRELFDDPSYRAGMGPSRRGLPPASVPLVDATGAERGELLVLEIGADQAVLHRLVGIARLR